MTSSNVEAVFGLPEPADVDHAKVSIASALARVAGAELDVFSQQAGSAVSSLSTNGVRLVFGAAKELWAQQLVEQGGDQAQNTPDMLRLSILASHARRLQNNTTEQSS